MEMGRWRVLGTMGLLLAMTPLGWAQTCTLAETSQPGECFQIQLNMKLSGEIQMRKDDKVGPLKLEATAVHEYPERVLAVAPDGLVQKTARIYETAKATIAAGGERAERTLRPERRLIVAQFYKDQALVYSPSGPLTREELELTGDQFNSTVVAGILPGKDVSVGETWKVSS